MKTLQHTYIGTRLRLLTLCLGAASLSACGMLQPTAKAPPAFYALEYAKPSTAPSSTATGLPAMAAATLIISPVRAASGFDSQRIIYVREPHKIEYFAHNEWIDTPARMLGPLLVASIENTGSFRAVVLTPSAASGDLRLDTEIVRLQQEFLTKPSMVHFTLRTYLVDEKTRKVLASREFDRQIATNSDDPRAGVEAANRAVQSVLEELAQFLAQRPR
ncbi:MAG: ABC-type transport auxiliary lipoprotein family protein [Pseudomonadota bacterium]